MAKRGYYPRRNKDGRRAVLAVLLVLVVAVVAYLMLGRDQQVPAGVAEEGVVTQPPSDEVKVITTTDEPPQQDQPPVEPAAVVEEKVEQPTVVENANADLAAELFRAGAQAMRAQDYVVAREKLSRAVNLGLKYPEQRDARRMLSDAADQWLFSRNIFTADTICRLYQVKQGDQFVALAKQFDVPYQLLMRLNNIKKPESLPAGKNIKVVQGPFHVVIELKRFLMSVYLDDVLVRSYPVGLGKVGRDTPTGRWLVRVKQVNPKWIDREQGKTYHPDDPDNPLGERWIALEGVEGAAKGRSGFGIHGTISPESIGKNGSRGCIRLHNRDVEELFDLLASNKSEVYVVE